MSFHPAVYVDPADLYRSQTSFRRACKRHLGFYCGTHVLDLAGGGHSVEIIGYAIDPSLGLMTDNVTNLELGGRAWAALQNASVNAKGE